MASKALIQAKTNKSNKIDGTFFDKPVITVKEARKIIGKKLSDQLSDQQLEELIGQMELLANRLLIAELVPQNNNFTV